MKYIEDLRNPVDRYKKKKSNGNVHDDLFALIRMEKLEIDAVLELKKCMSLALFAKHT